MFAGLIFPGKQLRSQPILLSTLPEISFSGKKEHWEWQETESRSSQHYLSFGIY